MDKRVSGRRAAGLDVEVDRGWADRADRACRRRARRRDRICTELLRSELGSAVRNTEMWFWS